MSQILIPTTGPDDWSRPLASPEHWRTGYSARSLAHCWQDAAGRFPPEVKSLMETAPALASAEVLLAVPEHKVQLPGAGKASQTDLWLLARTESGLASIAVEGKVGEEFGPTVGKWLEAGGENRATRLAGLCQLLGIPSIPPGVRYQLLHRTASAVLESKRFMTAHAAMIVHSFSQSDEWYEDFESFVDALGGVATKGRLVAIPNHHRPTLHLGWVRGAARFLQA